MQSENEEWRYVTPFTNRTVRKTVFITVSILFLGISTIYGDIKFNNGWWKTEVTGGIGLDIAGIDRGGDMLGTVLVEYEFPLTRRLTLGPGFIPFMWVQPHKSASETIWGGGLGLTSRYYGQNEKFRGWYAEIRGHMVLQEGEIWGNTSKFNFLIGCGFGYRFHNNWNSAVKFEHISNGGLGERNQSLNTISLGIGYTF